MLDDAYLTLASDQAAQAALVLRARHIVPLHFEDWAHFSQGRDTLDSASPPQACATACTSSTSASA